MIKFAAPPPFFSIEQGTARSTSGSVPRAALSLCNLVTHVTFLTLPLNFQRMKHIRISRRLQIMRAKGRHWKLARLRWIEVLSFASARQFLTVDLALQFHESMQQRFGPGRAAGNIDVNRDIAVDAFQ